MATVTKTVGSNSRDYATLTIWEDAQNGDITAGGRDEIAIAECYNDSVLADNNLTIDDWTTDDTHYIKITTPTAERHHGMPYTGFRIYHGGTNCLSIKDGNIWIDGISFIGNSSAIYAYGINANNGWLKVSNCLFSHCNYSIRFYTTISVVGYFWNCSFIECSYGIQAVTAGDEVFAYNCSAYRCNYGYYASASSSFVVKNCVSIDGLTSDFYVAANFDAASSNNGSTAASGDTDKAPGSNSVYSITAEDNYTTQDPGVEDLHIVGTGADLYNAGVDLSGVADNPITDDIDSETRSRWDIGSDEFSSNPPAPPTAATTSTSTVGTVGKDYATLTLWEDAKDGDLTIANSYDGGVEVAECYNTGVMSDNLTLTGWTTDTRCYIKIYTPVTERQTGLLGTGFRVNGGASTVFDIRDGNVWVDGISFIGSSRGIYGYATANPGWLKTSRCVFDVGLSAIEYTPWSSLVGWFRGYFWNNFIIGGSYGIYVVPATATGRICYVYNNSIYGSTRGIYTVYSDLVIAKNNAVLGNTNDFYLAANFHSDSEYNASTAASGDTDKAPGANSIYSIVAADNFNDLTGGSEDLHIKEEYVDIYRVGTDLSGDAYLVVENDIDGVARDSWDMGGDYFFVVPDPINIPDSLPTSAKISGRNLRDFNLELISYPEVFIPPIVERLQVIGGRSGSRDFGASYDVWHIAFRGQFQADSHRDFVESKTNFLRWIDVEQHIKDEWLVGGNVIRGMKLELAGHRYYYNTGTVSVTNNNRVVTGSGTEWTTYIKPHAEIRFKGLVQQRYTVEQVISDTQLLLGINYQGDTEAGIDYEIERKRYLLVQYEGNSSIAAISRHFRDDVFNFTCRFRTVYPYWVGDKWEQEEDAPGAGTFVEIKGIGTAPFGPIYQIVGGATDPEICACEYAFHSNFNGNTNARTILNKEDITGTTSATGYEPTRNNKGIYLTSPNNVYYASVPGYADKFSFVVRIKTNFASTAAGDKYIFDYRYDANNSFSLFYDASDDDWVLNIKSGGVDNLTIRTTNMQVFSADDEIEISGWYDSSGISIENTTYYGKIFVNGVESGSVIVSITKPAGNPSALYVGSLAAGTNFIDSVVDELALYVVALDDEDCISAYTHREPLSNQNATTSYSGTLDTDDILTIYSYCGEANYFDASEETTNRASLSGFEASLRGNKHEFGLVYLPNAISGKFRIVFHPHFR
jgi:hypothetical protein